jgi:hypothetical protein
MRVVANCAGRGKLRNGRVYLIVEIGEKVTLQHETKSVLEALVEPLEGAEGSEDETEVSSASTACPDGLMRLSRQGFFRQLRLPYARTYASIQDLTVKGLLALHDVDHEFICHRKLYVGLSRAQGRDFVMDP